MTRRGHAFVTGRLRASGHGYCIGLWLKRLKARGGYSPPFAAVINECELVLNF